MRLALYTIQLLMYTNEAHGLVPGGVELNCAYMGMHVHEIIKKTKTRIHINPFPWLQN